MTDKKDTEQLVKDIKMTFDTPHGERVLLYLMRCGYMLTPSFNTDTHVMAFNEGARNLVLSILSYLEVDIERLRKKIKEASNERTGY